MDDHSLLNVVESLERQLTYQTQIGGNPLNREPGRFVFTLNVYVDRRSEHMGVAERHYTANLGQEGQFIQHQRLTQALSDAIYSSLQNLIQNEQIPGRDCVLQFGQQSVKPRLWLPAIDRGGMDER